MNNDLDFLFVKNEIILELIAYSLPEKKQLSSPNLGRYGAHFGAENSTMTVKNETIIGNPYEQETNILYLLEFEGCPLK